MSNRSFVAAVLLSFGVLVLVSKELSSSAHQTRTFPRIYASDFGVNNVIGLLGYPLGTVVRVTGVVVDGEETRRKALSSETMLRINTVNGHPHPSPPMFICPGKQEDRPAPGTTFDYYVHEHGAFSGVVEPPKELGIDFPSVQHDGFQYRHSIAIHKSNIAQLKGK